MEYLKFNNFICFFFNLKSGQYLLDFKKNNSKTRVNFQYFQIKPEISHKYMT